MEMARQQDFENRFFDLLQKNLEAMGADMKAGFDKVNRKIDKNTQVTTTVVKRVDKLDGKVFGKKPSSLANIFGDKQIIGAFALALLVFLLIVANILHIKVPAL